MALNTHESRRRAQNERILDRADRISRRLRSLMLVGVILVIIVPAVFIHEDSGPFLLKVVSAGLLAFLPGWLYLQFIRNKGRNLYDEFVLNLFRLRIDHWANLPAPPEHTTYYQPWKESHGGLGTQSKDNLYRSKFEAIYGRSAVSTLGMIAEGKRRPTEHTEAFSPVIYATLIMALGWVLVLQPELLRLVQLGDVVPSGRPSLPVEALQFGFLGAYTFIIQDLVRRYYRDDLRTSGYIAAISRIVFSAVLIIALALVGGEWVGEQAPIYAFFIGFFPQIGLQVLKTAVAKPVQGLIPSLRSDYPMSSIEGLNFWYEARLNEEGIEDMQHLASANLVDLMLRTRAPIARLVDWLDQTFLHLHLPGDPEEIQELRTNLRQLGIRTASELESSWRELGSDASFKRMLSTALGVAESEGPIVVRSMLVTLNGESNYWHVREFRKIGWLSSDDGGASVTVTGDGTLRAPIGAPTAELHGDPRGSAVVPNRSKGPFQSRSAMDYSNHPMEGSPNGVRAGGRGEHEEDEMNPEHRAKVDERKQAQEAAERYRNTADQREEIERLQREEHRRVVDTPEQIEARAGRLFETGQVPQEAVMAAVPQDAQVERHRFLERIIAATNDLQAVNFLPRGARTARTVARISISRNGRMIPFGTGSLVSPRLLLTNNHVLPDIATAEQCTAEFNCELDVDMNNAMIAGYEVDPDRFFITNEHLDYSLVALKDGPDGRAPGDEFSWNQLIERQGKIVTGEPVNIVGHPMGRAKEMAIRNNLLQNQVDEFLHYTTDTEPGNSGSPVFNDQWEVVALHHAGVPSTDDAGNWLKPDGNIWHPNDGDHTVHWIANEGARVSVVLRDLKERQLSQTEQQLFDEMGLDTTAADAAVAQPVPAPSMSPVSAVAERQPSSPAKPGLQARNGPYGGNAQLVFLHGRRQEGLDPAALRRKWTGGLAKGLASTGLPPIDALDVWFPFYGDAFAHVLGAREAVPAFVGDSQVNAAEALAPREESTRELYELLIEEAADQAGLPPSMADDVAERESFVAGLVGKVQKQLTWLANRSGLDEVLIAAIFRDVADYLDHSDVRDHVLDTVMEHVPQSGRVVLVSHSLGTVVGMDLLSRLPDEVEVKHMITAGSPLGMDGVYKRLIAGGPQKPQRVSVWLNAWCAADAVAIGCPLNTAWGPFVTDVITSNPKERAHSIEEYLADERVATMIGRALGAPTD